MAISRVVKLSSLQQWVELNAHKTFCTKETVDAIIKVIERESVPLDYDTKSTDFVFLRVHQITKDRDRVFPWSESGGSLTTANPLTQVGVLHYNALKDFPAEKRNNVTYSDPTVTIVSDKNYTTLTINVACEV